MTKVLKGGSAKLPLGRRVCLSGYEIFAAACIAERRKSPRICVYMNPANTCAIALLVLIGTIGILRCSARLLHKFLPRDVREEIELF